MNRAIIYIVAVFVLAAVPVGLLAQEEKNPIPWNK